MLHNIVFNAGIGIMFTSDILVMVYVRLLSIGCCYNCSATILVRTADLLV